MIPITRPPEPPLNSSTFNYVRDNIRWLGCCDMNTETQHEIRWPKLCLFLRSRYVLSLRFTLICRGFQCRLNFFTILPNGLCRLPETLHMIDVSVTPAKTSDTTCMESMVSSNIDKRAT